MSSREQWISMKIYLLLVVGTVCCLEILSPTAYVEKASGGSARLDCIFTLNADDHGNLDIEWNLKPADQQRDEKLLIHFAAGQICHSEPYKKRVHFHSLEPQNGDASINLLSLNATDSRTYECKVKKVPGIQCRLITLRVLLAPSQLQCSTEGVMHVGQNVVLVCEANDGNLPMTYTWKRTTNSTALPASAKQYCVTGNLYLQDVGIEDSGSYQYTAKNRVGTEKCLVQLRITSPSTFSTAGLIAGVLVTIGVVLITGVVIFWYFYKCKQTSEDYGSNDILLDTPPPKPHRITLTND